MGSVEDVRGWDGRGAILGWIAGKEAKNGQSRHRGQNGERSKGNILGGVGEFSFQLRGRFRWRQRYLKPQHHV
jgi:hypothetical protein